MSNNSTQTQNKIKLISENIPEIRKCNPHDKQVIEKIKTLLFENGYYKNEHRRNDPTADESVIRLIRRLQGQRVSLRTVDDPRKRK